MTDRVQGLDNAFDNAGIDGLCHPRGCIDAAESRDYQDSHCNLWAIFTVSFNIPQVR